MHVPAYVSATNVQKTSQYISNRQGLLSRAACFGIPATCAPVSQKNISDLPAQLLSTSSTLVKRHVGPRACPANRCVCGWEGPGAGKMSVFGFYLVALPSADFCLFGASPLGFPRRITSWGIIPKSSLKSKRRTKTMGALSWRALVFGECMRVLNGGPPFGVEGGPK